VAGFLRDLSAQAELVAMGVACFVEHYLGVDLDCALGYITLLAFMAGQALAIWVWRGRDLVMAREQRRQCRQEQAAA